MVVEDRKIDCRIGYRRQKWGIFTLSLIVSWSVFRASEQFKTQANPNLVSADTRLF